MRSLRHVGTFSAGLSLQSDEVTELHTARLLLLIELAGVDGQIQGLTKLAKLDFFVRYPQFFSRVTGISAGGSVESSMIRFHYGPWDKRYYQLFADLSARGLLSVAVAKRTVHLQLTDSGRDYARRLAAAPEFSDLVGQIERVAALYRNTSGNALKTTIYSAFKAEVVDRRRGAVILP